MTPDRFARIERAFHALRNRPPAERCAMLERLRPRDPAAADALERMLEADAVHDGFLEAPTATSPAPRAAASPVGRRVGTFTIRRVISSGSSSAVFEAEQRLPRRIVALKVLRHSATSSAARKRFEYERQVLAHLRHPAIAAIYEAGVFRIGDAPAPYFAMEYIPAARTIVDHARSQALGRDSMIRLMIEVCDAVHHGHQRGIIHRDLKPGNILVGADGRPKVIDFGVACAVAPAGDARHTTAGQLVGTLHYMSPEQCDARPGDLDVRSDVYALGVVLYELLCGRLPYDLAGRPLLDAARIIQSQPPIRPSLVLPSLRGDLETLLLKALAKERSDRYQSAAELGSDLQRVVEHRPILAQPPGLGRRARLFARRNRGLVAAAVLGFASLLGGALTSTWFALDKARLAKQEQSARTTAEELGRREAALRDEAERVIRFLQDMLASADPNSGPANRSLVEMIDNASQRVESEFAGIPAVAARLDHALGDVQLRLGRLTDAERHLARAHAWFARSAEPSVAALIAVDQADALIQLARFDEAAALLDPAIATLRAADRGNGADFAYALKIKSNWHSQRTEYDAADALLIEALAVLIDEPETTQRRAKLLAERGDLQIKRGRYADAEALLTSALEVFRAQDGPRSHHAAAIVQNLAAIRVEQGRWADAHRLILEAIDVFRERYDPDHPAIAQSLNTLGVVLQRMGRGAEAERAFRDCLAIQRRRLAPNHPEIADLLNNLGFILKDRGAYEEAESLYDEALRIQQKAAPTPEQAFTLVNLATVRKLRGDFAGALPHARRALDLRRQLLGPDHPHVLYALNVLGELLTQARQLDEAEPLLEEAVRRATELLGPRHWVSAVIRSNLALVWLGRGQPAAAEPVMRDVLALAETTYPPGHPSIAGSQYNLGLVLQRTGSLEEAERLLRDALRSSERSLPVDHPALAVPRMRLGSVLVDLGDWDAAEALLCQAVETFEKTVGPRHWQSAFARGQLARVYLKAGRLEEARLFLDGGAATCRATLGGESREALELESLDRLLAAAQRAAPPLARSIR